MTSLTKKELDRQARIEQIRRAWDNRKWSSHRQNIARYIKLGRIDARNCYPYPRGLSYYPRTVIISHAMRVARRQKIHPLAEALIKSRDSFLIWADEQIYRR